MKLTILFLLLCSFASAQAQTAPLRKVENVEIKNLRGEPANIPNWGEKNLLIFYIDPDRSGMNKSFTDELEKNKTAEGENIKSLGIINLGDAPFIPNRLARSMALKRTEKNGITVLSDEKRIISQNWGLGDCNNEFVLLLINRNSEIVFERKGVLSEDDKQAARDIILEYK